uniref:Uncharacterized protein n=1 Tax=Anguilla anguilla TaxID=7936 RepID=A0A0E9WEB9_ANGAN
MFVHNKSKVQPEMKTQTQNSVFWCKLENLYSKPGSLNHNLKLRFTIP